ncbi:hypothetical protein N3K66_008850 [Trichothecium roseum]|uniref:Uncharacterized protein n=1 Tax=Trichothecium roseum TaxID=47278 RepID=A0ACC0URR5_9HYPO|nr:hypothetical protein N3K66_008850 [Trichothecium roseum]
MQGFNMGRYRPPSTLDNALSSSPSSNNNKRASSSTASSSSLPANRGAKPEQTVRFEMPFAIWCTTCQPEAIIGQGVRFNAAKRRAGRYHSTTEWLFLMRHPPCGGTIQIRTDPRNTAYVVVSGARKRDYGDDDHPLATGDPDRGAILTDEERQKLRSDAFSNLEKTIADRRAHDAAALRIDELRGAANRAWRDDYASNRRLRDHFRHGRRERERAAAADDDLRDRLGFGYDVAPETEEDARRAAVVEFRALPSDDAEDGDARAGGRSDRHDDDVLSKPLFGEAAVAGQRRAQIQPVNGSAGTVTGTGTGLSGEEKKKSVAMLKRERERQKQKGKFVSIVMGNTMAGRDPFLSSHNGNNNNNTNGSREKTPPVGRIGIPGVKRKRAAGSAADGGGGGGGGSEQPAVKAAKSASTSLVAYGSDSD